MLEKRNLIPNHGLIKSSDATEFILVKCLHGFVDAAMLAFLIFCYIRLVSLFCPANKVHFECKYCAKSHAYIHKHRNVLYLKHSILSVGMQSLEISADERFSHITSTLCLGVCVPLQVITEMSVETKPQTLQGLAFPLQAEAKHALQHLAKKHINYIQLVRLQYTGTMTHFLHNYVHTH